MIRWVLLIVILLLSACGTSTGGPTSGLAQIDSVDVRVAESFPPQVFVHIRGTLGDGCTSLGTISQERKDNAITVTVRTNHSGADACTAIATLLDETIRLDGDFGPGQYTVTVNGVVQTFTI
jgi:hypothetical protein